MNFGIIAAGEGSRLRQEGVELPKPLVRIEGKPMIGRLIDIFALHNPGKVCVIVNEYMTEVREYLDKLAPTLPFPLETAVKTTPSSMHSFHALSSMLGGHGRFILTTVDTVFRASDFNRYVEAFASQPPATDGLMAVTTHIDDEKPLYVQTRPDMTVTAFRDTPWPEAEYISAGIYGLDSRAIRVLDKCIESGISRMRNFQRALIADGLDIRAFDLGPVFDVDHASDIEKARKFLSNVHSVSKTYPSH